MLIASLDHLAIIDSNLDGSHGLNRAPHSTGEPVVNTDIEAVCKFLDIHKATPTTQRNYTKEIERLILWAINIKGKPLSSLSSSDLEKFIEFLADPQPAEIWVARQKFQRDSDKWRPFVVRKADPLKQGDMPRMVAGLSPSSRLTAMASLSAMFSWLVNYGYLVKNPMQQIKTLRKRIRVEGHKTSSDKVERYLDESMWAAFQDAIEMMPKKNQVDIEQYERAKFLSALMLFLAPRANEIAQGRMNDFRSDGARWWWYVVGKGSKSERIPAVDGMIDALIRYRTFLGMSPLPLNDDISPLMRSVWTGEAITTRQINHILDALFEDAARLLEGRADECHDQMERAEWKSRAAKIRKASSHWGRHTSITFQVRSDIPLNLVQRNARHADMKTTGLYTHEDLQHWHNQSQKLHF